MGRGEAGWHGAFGTGCGLGWWSFGMDELPKALSAKTKGERVDFEEDKAEALLAENQSKTVPKRWQICRTAETEWKNRRG
jgi:hypothetical protein